MVRIKYAQVNRNALEHLEDKQETNSYMWSPWFCPAIYVKYDKAFSRRIKDMQNILHFHKIKSIVLEGSKYLPKKTITVKSDADCILQLKNGWKFFYLKENLVKKVWLEESLIRRTKNELNIRNKIQQQSAVVPRVKKAQLTKSPFWYTEELVQGKRVYIANMEEFLDINNQVMNSLQQLYTENKEVNLKTYTTEKIAEIQTKVNSHQGMKGCRDEVVNFLENIQQQLQEEGKEEITVIKTHGDVTLANILKVNEHLVLMDWEFCDLRSCFFDVFVLWCNTQIFHSDLGFLPITKQKLSNIEISVAGKKIKNEKVYWLVAVLEKISIILENKDQKSEKRMKKWLTVFNQLLAP